MRTCNLLCVLFAALFSAGLFAEDKPADVVALENKAGTVAISLANNGLRTIFIVVAEKKEDTDSQTKINALKDAIKQLETRIDVLKKVKKEEEKAEPKNKADIEIIPTETLIPVSTEPLDPVIHYTENGTAYIVVPKGSDPNDPKFWMIGNKPFCRDCWKLRR